MDDVLEKIRGIISINKNDLELTKDENRERILEINRKMPSPADEKQMEELLDDVYGDSLTWFEKGKFISKRLGDYIMSRNFFKTQPHSKSETIYVYRNGVYKDIGESVIKREVNTFLGEKIKNHYVSEVTGYVGRSTYIYPEQINQDPYVINIKNGFYDLKQKKLLPHNPEIFSITQLPIFYDSQADCPVIKKFVSEIVSIQDVNVLQELIGYCLWKDYHIQKAFMFLGEGQNGKSVFIKMLTAFLGTENVACVELQDLHDKFAKASLFGKMANLYPDISNKALFNTGVFKGLTGGDELDAQFKFKDPFHFRNFAKMIFSCNTIPETRDFTTAFFRRWIIINFPNIFDGKKDDKLLINKLTTQDELSGLFNWALEGLERLLKNNDFSYAPTTEQMEARYKKLSSSIAGFIDDCCQMDTDSELTKDELYLAYCKYCRENQLVADSRETFYRKLPIYAEHIKDVRGRIEGRRIQIIKGIKLKDNQQTKEREKNIDDFLNNDVH
jgi:putative DNA primase/helicase